jgi:hypothetical protein
VITDDEFGRRLAGILNGPWAEPMKRALAALSGPSGEPEIDQDQLSLTSEARQTSERLRHALRDHVGSPIIDPNEMRLRADFDRALLVLQVLELAIQGGYLPEERASNVARHLLSKLLWSQAARDYVHIYEYPAVPMLATRVGVRGLRTAEPPPASGVATDSLQFAAFLAHLRSFYDNDTVRTWFDFMDDIIVEEYEQDAIKRYWRRRGLSRPQRERQLAAGSFLFVQELASAFEAVDEHQRAMFGMPHAYWLAKFFGLRIGETKYEHDPFGTDWSWCMGTRHHLGMEKSDEAAYMAVRTDLQDRLALLEQVILAVDKVVSATRTQVGRPLG